VQTDVLFVMVLKEESLENAQNIMRLRALRNHLKLHALKDRPDKMIWFSNNYAAFFVVRSSSSWIKV